MEYAEDGETFSSPSPKNAQWMQYLENEESKATNLVDSVESSLLRNWFVVDPGVGYNIG